MRSAPIKKAPEGLSLRGFRVVAILVLLQGLDVGGLRTLGTVGNLEAHALTLRESLEPIACDGRKVHENIGTVSLLDKAKTLGITEPLYCSFCHLTNSLFNVCPWETARRTHKKKPRT